MLIFITIFIVSTISLFGMLWYRAWEIQTKGVSNFNPQRNIPPEIYFRQIEKIMLYLTKHAVQWIVLFVAKYWFIIAAKANNWVTKNLPKINKFFTKKEKGQDPTKRTFVERAILESKIKIKRVKERVKKEQEEKNV